MFYVSDKSCLKINLILLTLKMALKSDCTDPNPTMYPPYFIHNSSLVVREGNTTLFPDGTNIKRKRRIIFTNEQVQILEQEFNRKEYLSANDRDELAHKIGLKPTQVR